MPHLPQTKVTGRDTVFVAAGFSDFGLRLRKYSSGTHHRQRGARGARLCKLGNHHERRCPRAALHGPERMCILRV